jgi:hypothetical protein
MRSVVFTFLVLSVLSAGFMAVGLLIAFWPTTYLQWTRWSNVEHYAPWFFRDGDAHGWRSKIVGIWMVVFGVIFAILSVYICWFQ